MSAKIERSRAIIQELAELGIERTIYPHRADDLDQLAAKLQNELTDLLKRIDLQQVLKKEGL